MLLCEACSAPLPPNKNLCNYCGTRSDVDLKGIHHYTVNKPSLERTCPSCGIALKTLDLNLEGNFFIERCEKCLGIFFDPGELEAVLEKSVSEVFNLNIDKINSLSEELDSHNFKVVYRGCPVCRKLMHRISFGAGSGVIIDSCKADGIWLDGGELKRLMEWKKAGGQILDQQTRARAEAEKLREQIKRAREQAFSKDSLTAVDSISYEGEFEIIGSVLKAVSRFLTRVVR